MKKGEKNILFFEIIVLLILVLNSFAFNLLNGLKMSLFLGLVFIIFKSIFGFEKSNYRVSREIILDTLIFLLSFFILYYISGLFVGFAKIGNYFTFNGLANYIIPLILNVIFKEILRYNLLLKSNNNKKLIIIGIIMFIMFDITNSIYFNSFNSIMHIFKFVALILLPSISFNIYATYVSVNAGFKSIILYSLVIKLYMYVIPIMPNYSEYLLSIMNLLLPMILLYKTYNTIKNENDEQISREYNSKGYIGLAVTALIVTVLVYFTSGYFKYHAVAIATGSMSPSINRGDIVVIKKTNNYDDFNIGEVIAYNYHGVLVVHRLDNIIKADNQYLYYSKGDANKYVDNYAITEDMLIGIVMYKIPYIGYPTVRLNEMWED